jgi:hypothetical protein
MKLPAYKPGKYFLSLELSKEVWKFDQKKEKGPAHIPEIGDSNPPLHQN